MNNNIIDVDESDFENSVINESDNRLIVVDFWAPWCGPCKQLTPTMEKVANENKEVFNLVKINIDENQQIASQLRIQSIPAVYAFKEKQVVNAFQGVISEKDFIQFLEKSLGKKLKESFTDFYTEITNLISNKKLDEAKDQLIEFFTENTNDPVAVSLYLECLLEQKEFKEIEEFISSLDEDIKKNHEIIKIIKKLKIVRENINSESIEILLQKHQTNPKDIKSLLKISEYYFSTNDYDRAFSYLLNNYNKDKETVKKKLVEFFEALGNEHEATKTYRKKFSSLLFA